MGDKKQEVYTHVKPHKRKNPKNPGEHHVKGHERKVGQKTQVREHWREVGGAREGQISWTDVKRQLHDSQQFLYNEDYSEGDTVPLMTEYGDIQAMKILEIDGDDALVEAVEPDMMIGMEKGDETYLPKEDIDTVFEDLKPYERKELRRAYEDRMRQMMEREWEDEYGD